MIRSGRRVNLYRTQSNCAQYAPVLTAKQINIDAQLCFALYVLEAAHAICPYSVATRGNVEVTLVVV